MLTAREIMLVLASSALGSGVGVLAVRDHVSSVVVGVKVDAPGGFIEQLNDCQSSSVECLRGVIENRPESVYCAGMDRPECGFLSNIEPGKYQMVDGKIWRLP